jgi:hypothetical protein
MSCSVDPVEIARAEKEIVQSLPMWVYELPHEAFAAELASRIVFHPTIQKFTKSDAHLNDLLMASIEEIVLKQVKFNYRNGQTEVKKQP